LNAYRPPMHPLQGCINDVTQMQRALGDFYGFKAGDVRILLDADASRAAILKGIEWLTDGASPGDVLVFHYSGHGSQVDDDSGDEWDCQDEILLPYDHDWNNPLRDDDLKQRFDRVPVEVNLTIISDSCHSGTVNKDVMPYEVPRVAFVPPEIQARIAEKVAHRNAEFRAFVATESRRMQREMPADELDTRIGDFLAEMLNRFKANRFQFVDTRLNNILLAACQDLQTSTDAYIARDWHGAFTYNLIKTIEQASGKLTYADLVTRAGNGMVGYDQVPQLECPDALRNHSVFMPFRIC